MSQNNCCGEEEALCAFAAGDTVPFAFEFLQPDTSPMDIGDKEMHFIMDAEGELTGAPGEHFEKKVIFPVGEVSRKGKGFMKLLPDDTAQLISDRDYKFKFRLIGGPEDKFTIGSGPVHVN